MIGIDLNHLKTFVVVVENGSVTEAAKKLFRTQPAISAQIGQLEADLDIKLFERRGRNLALTKEGVDFYEVARKKLFELDEELTRAAKGKLKPTGNFKIAAIPDIGHRLVLSGLKEFQALYPEIKCFISFGPSELVEDYLLNRHYDLGFVTESQTPQKFVIERTTDVEHILVANPTYIKSHQNTLQDATSMLGANWIDCADNCRLVRLWYKANHPKLVEKLNKRKPDIVVDTFQGLVEAAKLGLGVAVVPKYLAQNALKDGSLKAIFTKSKPIPYPIYVIQRTKHYRRQIEEDFLQIVKKVQIN